MPSNSSDERELYSWEKNTDGWGDAKVIEFDGAKYRSNNRVITRNGAIMVAVNEKTNAEIKPLESSPTGTPVVPPKAAAWFALVAGVALALTEIAGLPAVVYTIAKLIVGLAAVFGVVSPGVRVGHLPGQLAAKPVDPPKPSV